MASIDLVHDTFKYHIIIMKISGLYPFDSWPEIYNIYAFVIYILFTLLMPVLAITYVVTKEERSIETFSQDGFMLVQLSTIILKIIPCKVNPDGTKRTMQALNQRIFNSQLPQQDVILSKTVNNCRLVSQVFGASSLSAMLIWACSPLMAKERGLPMRIWLPYNWLENIAVYWSAFFFLMIYIINVAANSMSIDSLLAFLLYHAATQIRVLKDTLMYLGERTADQISKESASMGPEEREKLKASIVYKKICHCIDHYEAIYKFVKDIERTYSTSLFIQMLGSTVVICICCFNFSNIVPFTVAFFYAVAFLLTMCIELFLYCYTGTLLYEESNSVITAIYMSDWYTYDEKSKKALITLMERAKRPIKVTAGKFLNLSLETFAMILHRSYSLLAVLQNY